MRRRELLLGGAGLALWPVSGLAVSGGKANMSAADLLDIAQLPRFQPVARTGNVSSYDRTGGNDDGFSGKYSFLRKEAGDLVIADLTGPGVLTHLHTPTPPDTRIAFYFDGETTPRLELPFRDMFSGTTAPFTGQLVGHALGGYYSYVPLDFAVSLKVVVRGDHLQFYDLNYALYDPDLTVESWRPGDTFTLPRLPASSPPLRRTHTVAPGATATLFTSAKPGRITSLRLGPTEALAGKARDLILRMTWDGAAAPAVEVPAGDLFGYSFGKPAAQSLLFGHDDVWAYLRFPMPYARAAHIELVSRRDEAVTLQSEICISPVGRRPDEGWFHAQWRRENPTTDGKPFTFVDTAGRGHLVGITLQCQGAEPGNTFYFEGDEVAMLDGEMAVHGTGSEDGFNGGWYAVPGQWAQAGSLPLSGCLEYTQHLSRTGAYRLMIGDAYRFRRSLAYTIEHGGDGNKVVADYVGVSFLYLDRPAGDRSALGTLAVVDPDVFELEMASPPDIPALFLLTLELDTRDVGGQGIGVATLERNLGWFGAWPPKAPDSDPGSFDTEAGPPVMLLRFSVPRAGLYELSVEGLIGPDRAMIQLRVDSALYGAPVDFYAETPGRSGLIPLGDLSFIEGDNTVTLCLPRRNPKSTGEAVDLVRIRGQRKSA